MFGAIEAGGTKFVCAVGNDKLEVVKRTSFPTTTPKETINQVINFFKPYRKELKSIGIGSFGPIDIKLNSKTYGYITTTPKEHWSNYDFLGELKQSVDVPMAFTTDVNAACYGEYVLGQGKNVSSLVYFTIGTGVGGGAIQDGNFIEGFSHPEMGHMIVRQHPEDSFLGNCPFHKNCLEGMASGPAIEKRLETKGQDIPPSDPYWEIEAYYLAQCAFNTTLILAPEKIIFGGGVMKKKGLIDLVREKFVALLADYVLIPDIETYLVTPELEDNAGIIGGLALAKNIAE